MLYLQYLQLSRQIVTQKILNKEKDLKYPDELSSKVLASTLLFYEPIQAIKHTIEEKDIPI